ncbi:hypothetical protein GCM10009117_20020 [Gangjinia marincola]|uniref:Transporter n=1 Tax=Gangjinia marincola TaxID=578463 RepID=A0ABN1MIA2_9FLAO
MKIRIYLGLAFFWISCAAIAQEDNSADNTIITDRPDATEAPQTVPAGALQIETGAFYTSFKDEEQKIENFTYNTALLRYGIFDDFELRLGWDYSEIKTTQYRIILDDIEQTFTGLSPLLAGMKVAIKDEEGWIPQIGLIGHVFLPFTAGDNVKPEYTSVDFRFSFAHTLSKKSSIAYNLGAQWENDSPEAAYVYTLAYGYALTDKFGFYAEVYGDLPEDSSANHFWDAGITYLVKNNLQLDATVGGGINEGAEQDILLSAGFSLRLPN